MWGRFSNDKIRQPAPVEPELTGLAEPAQATLAPAEPAPEPVPAAPLPGASVRGSDMFLSMKVDLHRHLIERFNLSMLDRASKEEVAGEIRPLIRTEYENGSPARS